MAIYNFEAMTSSGQWILVGQAAGDRNVGGVWLHALDYPAALRVRVTDSDGAVIIEARRG